MKDGANEEEITIIPALSSPLQNRSVNLGVAVLSCNSLSYAAILNSRPDLGLADRDVPTRQGKATWACLGGFCFLFDESSARSWMEKGKCRCRQAMSVRSLNQIPRCRTRSLLAPGLSKPMGIPAFLQSWRKHGVSADEDLNVPCPEHSLEAATLLTLHDLAELMLCRTPRFYQKHCDL